MQVFISKPKKKKANKAANAVIWRLQKTVLCSLKQMHFEIIPFFSWYSVITLISISVYELLEFKQNKGKMNIFR